MNPQIKERFRELKITGQRGTLSIEEKRQKDLELIDYLKSVIANEEVTGFEDIGFYYWNISDNYALLRDGHALRKNHQTFYEHIMSYDASYLYWLVCDATQRLTLEADGYTDWWWSLYREAVSCNSEKTSSFAGFCAHRAALYKNPVLPTEQRYVAFAMESFRAFLEKAKDSPEYPFYRLLYLTSAVKYVPVDKKEMEALSKELLPSLLSTDVSRDFSVGEWKSFTTPFGKRKCAVVGITSAVNALIDEGELKAAKELYRVACENGLPENAYIVKRLKD